MALGKLNTLQVRRLTKPGRYGDGGNLYLFVKPSGARLWTLRYRLPGQKSREMSLGNEADVSLAEARDKAREARRMIDGGRDPVAVRVEARREAVGQGKTFGEVAELYMGAHERSWRNAKHRAQWRSTLDNYAAPIMGKLP